MERNMQNATPIKAGDLSTLGVEFESVAQKESSQEAVELLLSVLGKKYQCERVYVFEKNQQGNYDCTNEWVGDSKNAKKHLLQNLSKSAVKQYYRHFARNAKLIIREMEDFAKEDYPLYKMLKAQDLSCLMVGQLIYDNEDKGFIGIDNPNPEYFDKLLILFDFIAYFVAVQKNRDGLGRRIAAVNQTMLERSAHKRSMYDRLTELKPHEAMAVIYCSVATQGVFMNYSSDVISRTITYTEQMFDNMFGASNVYNLGRNEFIIIYEETETRSLEEIDHYMSIAGKSLARLNAHLLKGVAATSDYKEDFFELVNLANAYMQSEKNRYKQEFTGKYHFDDDVFRFCDLVEIRPERGNYSVLYSEYLNEIAEKGSVKDFIAKTKELFVENDKKRFEEFCTRKIYNYRTNAALIGEPYCEHFTLNTRGGSTQTIEVVVMHYKDIAGESVLMCYTR